MMTWKYETLIQEHQLMYEKSILARIQARPTKKGKYIVTTLISGIYYGVKKQKQLEKQHKEWVAYRKKFNNKELANSYILRKKQEVSRFIHAREKEG